MTLFTWDTARLIQRDVETVERIGGADGSGPSWVAPQPLPFRLIDTGLSFTSLVEWPLDRLANAGFVASSSAPSHDPATQHPPVWDGAAAAWVVTDKTGAEQLADAVAALSAAQAVRVAEIQAERDAILIAGAPYAGRRIEVTDRARADLAGLSLAALLAQADPSAWTAGYALGWITADNSRIPLPSPADGLALAAAVGAWYAAVIQAARTAKDAALAVAFDPDHPWAWQEALGAVVPDWPDQA